MITERQLRYFDALARTLHFGRAAELVGVTQPALSMQIRELEGALGGSLVERGHGQPLLTPLGAEVAERATLILAGFRDLQDLAASQDEPLSGALRLGVIPSVAPYLLPRLLPVLAERHPQLRLTLREAITASIVAELKDGSLDAIVVSLPVEEATLEELEAMRDRFLLAVPGGSDLDGRNRISPGQVAADELLLLADGHCLRDQALAVCHSIDQRRLRSFGATSLTTLLELVAAGQGITLLPEMAADRSVQADGRIRLIPFEDPEPARTLGVAWRKGSPRRQDFVALRDAIAAA